jgi:hypothetical protein
MIPVFERAKTVDANVTSVRSGLEKQGSPIASGMLICDPAGKKFMSFIRVLTNYAEEGK